MLRVEGIGVSYGSSRAVFDVSLHIEDGEVVTLLGRNGMGKTTTIQAIMGLTPPDSGAVLFRGREIHRLPPYRIARLGIGLVPEGRQIFPNLTVLENLLVTAANYNEEKPPYTPERIFSIFPRLAERRRHRGGSLSGGEQQMLAIARALMIGPRLLLLDEATEGLAPLICGEIRQGLTTLKERGLAILVVDKNIPALKRIADRHYMLEKGKIVWNGTSGELTETVTRRYLGI